MMNHKSWAKKLSMFLSAVLLVTGLIPVGAFAEEGVYVPLNLHDQTLAAEGKYYTDYGTMEDLLEAGHLLNIQIAEEGMVLLKNENNALPLSADETNVSLFGYHSASLRTGGGGSGSGVVGKHVLSPDPMGVYHNDHGYELATLEDSMKAAGFQVNSRLMSMYESIIASAGTVDDVEVEPGMEYYENMLDSYEVYGDAAIITLGRGGSEGSDLVLMNAAGHADPTDHYLELQDNERELIKHVKKHFDKVIVLLNASNAMEIPELQAPKTDDNLGVDAIIQIGHVGNDGAWAIGRILNGTVNPSGHLVDTWAADFTKTPSYPNFGNMKHNGPEFDSRYYREDGTQTSYNVVEYREDIYNGYRYYETVAADLADAGEAWYAENVVYPFGYGLSYTTFDWALDEATAQNAEVTAANGMITMKVKVTNTGAVAGKDVVQVYVNPPYTDGGIEKASANLVGFAKTKLLAPGESEVVTVSFPAQDMASFDWDDRNGNGFFGYELEAGDYIISANSDAHTAKVVMTRTVADGILCETDLETGAQIEALFSQLDGAWADFNTTNESLLNNMISRQGGLDGSIPAAATKEDRTMSDADFGMYTARNHLLEYQRDDNYVTAATLPEEWTQASAEQVAARVDGKTEIQLADLVGVPFVAPYIDENGNVVLSDDEGTKKWTAFLNQMSFEEMLQLASSGGYGIRPMESIGKPDEVDQDGPAQLGWMTQVDSFAFRLADRSISGFGTAWVSNVVVGSAWNLDLAEAMGRIVGNESIFINCRGWYGPSCNIHRSPFSGRNFEYYSEDGVHSGLMAAMTIKGATEKGTICYVKHLFLNDQETSRNAIFTWATEQAIREIYAKPYEIAIKQGGSLGIMYGKNRIGGKNAQSNLAVSIGLLRNEWGFKGITLTDSTFIANEVHFTEWEHAGTNLVLYVDGTAAVFADQEPMRWDETARDGKGTLFTAASENDTELTFDASTLYYWIRHNVLYTLYNGANSNGMDNLMPLAMTAVADGNVAPEAPANSWTAPAPNFNYNVFGDEIFTGAYISGAKLIAAEGSEEITALPDGLTLSPGGVIVGRPTTEGTTTVTIGATVDSFHDIVVTLTINIGPRLPE